ncbi:MAG: hypothetical protein ABI673_07255 [Novosphingobium sp.]
MSSVSLSRGSFLAGPAIPAGQRQALGVILATAMAIAVVAPFDVAFTAATLGSPFLRAALIALLALVGARCALASGLSLTGTGRYPSLLIGIAAAAAMAAYVLSLDCWLYCGAIDTGYAAFLHLPLPYRLEYFMLRAFNENVIYRLFVFPALVWLTSRAMGLRALPTGIMIALMVLAQALNIGMNVMAGSDHPLTPALLAYDFLRYIVPGVSWAMLFWRFGFVSAEVASVGCHLFLQPGFSYFL